MTVRQSASGSGTEVRAVFDGRKVRCASDRPARTAARPRGPQNYFEL